MKQQSVKLSRQAHDDLITLQGKVQGETQIRLTYGAIVQIALKRTSIDDVIAEMKEMARK